MELGNLVAATGDFGRCIGLWPEFSWGYLHPAVARWTERQEGRGGGRLLGSHPA